MFHFNIFLILFLFSHFKFVKFFNLTFLKYYFLFQKILQIYPNKLFFLKFFKNVLFFSLECSPAFLQIREKLGAERAA